MSVTDESRVTDEIVTKHRKTDYASLLKYNAMLSSYDYMRKHVKQQISTLNASEKAKNKLNKIYKNNRLDSDYEITVNLYTKAIDQFRDNRDYYNEAVCQEKLAKFEYKFGETNEKLINRVLHKLFRSAHCYRRSNDHSKAIAALKRTILIAEFVHLNYNNSELDEFIINSYDECAYLYETVNMLPMAGFYRNCSTQFSKMCRNLRSRDSSSDSDRSLSSSSSHSNSRSNSDAEDESDHNRASRLATIKREKVTEVMARMDTSNVNDLSPPQTSERLSCEQINKNHVIDENEIRINNSREVEDIANDMNNSLHSSEDSRNELSNHLASRFGVQIPTDSDDSPVIRNLNACLPRDELNDSVNISAVTATRKRKKKDQSGVTPKRRLAKLKIKNLCHNFVIDKKFPEERLWCRDCNESLLAYRWTIITEHLKSNKHKEFSLINGTANQQNQSNLAPVVQIEQTTCANVNINNVTISQNTTNLPHNQNTQHLLHTGFNMPHSSSVTQYPSTAAMFNQQNNERNMPSMLSMPSMIAPLQPQTRNDFLM